MNLSTENKQTHGHGEQTCGCQGEVGQRGMNGECGVGRCKFIAFGLDKQRDPAVQHRELTTSNHLWWNIMETNVRKRTCNWVTLLYSQSLQNVVNQL